MDPIVDVLVETTQGSKHKYEYDHQLGAMRLDRRLYSAVSFPAHYGSGPGSWGCSGSATTRTASRREAKLITVAEGDPNFQEVRDLEQLPEHLLRELENFFDVDKMLEPGTSPAPDGYEGRPAALREIQAARERAAGTASG